ncbi:hypothetical protein ACEE23_01900 [Corynebacterium sp. 32222D000AT]
MNYLTTSEKHELCDMLDPERYLPTERALARYILVHIDEEPHLTRVAREVLGVGDDDA